jgi:hypothetical protein
MELVPMKEELTWSRQAAEHVAMLEQAQSSLSGSPASAARLKFAAASRTSVHREMREDSLSKEKKGLTVRLNA